MIQRWVVISTALFVTILLGVDALFFFVLGLVVALALTEANEKINKMLADQPKPDWYWPWYFRCWSCRELHYECKCGVYLCRQHEECLQQLTLAKARKASGREQAPRA
jgi:hypothetical protein